MSYADFCLIRNMDIEKLPQKQRFTGSIAMVYCRYTYAAPLVSDSFTPLVPFFRFVYRTIFQGELRVKKQGSAAGGKANENEEWRMKNEESAAGGKANYTI